MGKKFPDADTYMACIEQAINTYKEAYGKAPSVYELEELTGIPRSTVSRWIIRMKEAGVLAYTGRRGYETAADKAKNAESVVTQIYGLGATSLDKPETTATLPVALFGEGDLFVMKMADKMVIFDRNAKPKIGNLVVVEVGATVMVVTYSTNCGKIVAAATHEIIRV